MIGGDTSLASQGETVPVIRGEAAPASQGDTALANGGDIATEPPPAHRHATGLDIVRQLLGGQHGDHPADDGSGVVVDAEDQVLSFYKGIVSSVISSLTHPPPLIQICSSLELSSWRRNWLHSTGHAWHS